MKDPQGNAMNVGSAECCKAKHARELSIVQPTNKSATNAPMDISLTTIFVKIIQRAALKSDHWMVYVLSVRMDIFIRDIGALKINTKLIDAIYFPAIKIVCIAKLDIIKLMANACWLTNFKVEARLEAHLGPPWDHLGLLILDFQPPGDLVDFQLGDLIPVLLKEDHSPKLQQQVLLLLPLDQIQLLHLTLEVQEEVG